MVHDSSVGITNRCGLEGSGIESQADRYSSVPIPVAERSKARVCGQSLAGVAGSNPSSRAV